MARQQRQLHMQLYPNWTMRDSVASGAARKRRNKRDKTADGGTEALLARESTTATPLSISLSISLSGPLSYQHTRSHSPVNVTRRRDADVSARGTVSSRAPTRRSHIYIYIYIYIYL